MERWLSERNTFYASMQLEFVLPSISINIRWVWSVYNSSTWEIVQGIPKLLWLGTLTELLSSVFKWETLHQDMRRELLSVSSPDLYLYIHTHRCAITHTWTHTQRLRDFISRLCMQYLWASVVWLAGLVSSLDKASQSAFPWVWWGYKPATLMQWSLQTPGLAE